MTTALEIKRDIVIKAPRTKVWEALTTPEGWSAWFGEGIEGEFQVGQKLLMDFGKWGKSWGLVVEREELSVFAYKWHPGGEANLVNPKDDEMTTARFTLEDHPDGTKLTLVESGFENVPEDRRVSMLEGNAYGWKWELTELKAYSERGDRQMLSRDEIVRERVYPISREKLWDLVATPEGLKKWFVDKVEGDFEPGNIATLWFGENTSGPLKVIESNKPERFVFKWHPGEENGCTWDKYPEEETTQTSFVLTETDGGTLLTVTESGFENVPKDRFITALDLNNMGWTQVMDLIGKAVAGDS